MSDAQHTAAKQRFAKESQAQCPACGGSGRVVAESVSARARRGGNASYMSSLKLGRLSMSERGQKGGRPKEPTLQEMRQQQQMDVGMALRPAYRRMAPERGRSAIPTSIC